MSSLKHQIGNFAADRYAASQGLQAGNHFDALVNRHLYRQSVASFDKFGSARLFGLPRQGRLVQVWMALGATFVAYKLATKK